MTKPVPYLLTAAQYAVARRVIHELDAAAYVRRSQAEQEAVRQINAQLQVAGESADYTLAHLRGALGRRRRRKSAARTCGHPPDNVRPSAPYDVIPPQDFELLPPVDDEMLAELQVLELQVLEHGEGVN